MALTPADIVAKTGDLPTLPHVATKVMRLVSDPETSAKDLQEAIITDQGMTGQILKIANSAMFGLKREVRTLTHGIMLLGFQTIRSIVMASAAKNMYNKKGAAGFKEKLLWENSIGSALIARAVAEQFERLDKEECFIAGLMHNIGKTILNSKFPDQYSAIMAENYNNGTPIHELEQREFGFDHAELGYALLKQWNLSDPLCLSVKHYLNPQDAPAEMQRQTGTVTLGHVFCLDLGLGVSQPIPLEEQSLDAVFEIMDLNPARLEKWREIIARKIEEDRGVIQSF